MKIAIINTFNFGSTGNVAIGISEVANKNKYSSLLFIPESDENLRKLGKRQVLFGNKYILKFERIFVQFVGLQDCFSVLATLDLINKLRKMKPDIIHLHNLHSNYLNLPMLFKFIKKHNISVIWTLHDCWSFTGQCPHFVIAKCNRWKTGCYNCTQYRQYPAAFVDRTKTMWKLKRKWFTGVQNMTIVTPSQWLADLVKESYLKEYDVKVINNGIDLNVFKPDESDFREKHHITAKYIVLGVAFGWGKRKGFDVFLELSKRLDKDYQIVLVGTDENIDKQLPSNIISIHRTQNQQELAEIYTAADVLANPTREENYPTVNMEAIACGTPVVTFRTGGSPEIPDDTCGCVVTCDDIDAFEKEIRKVCSEKTFSEESCLKRAIEHFDMNDRFEEYIELYKAIMK